MGNKLIHSFLQNPEHHDLYTAYLQNPNETDKKVIEEKFKLHVMKLKMLSYFSKVLLFEAQRFDKKIREKATLPLLDGDGEDEIAPTEALHSPTEMINDPLLENFFENERLFNLVSNLNDNNKQLLYLLYVKDLDEDQVAIRLGITKQAVNKRKNHLLRKIKELYYD